MIEVKFLIEDRKDEASGAIGPGLFSPGVGRSASVSFEAPESAAATVHLASGNPLKKTYPRTVPPGGAEGDEVADNASPGHYDLELRVAESKASLQLEVVLVNGEPSVCFGLVPAIEDGFEAKLRRRLIASDDPPVRAHFDNRSREDVKLELTRPGHPPDLLPVPSGEDRHYDWHPGAPGQALEIVLLGSLLIQNGGTRLADIIVEPPSPDVG